MTDDTTSLVGDCYEAAVHYILDYCLGMGVTNPNYELRLVHGEVAAQGALEGCTMGHAWIEHGDTVIDTSNGRHIVLPKRLYYAIGHIEELDNTHVYTPEQVREMVLKHHHYGPWELKGKHPMYQRGVTDITPLEDDEDELE